MEKVIKNKKLMIKETRLLALITPLSNSLRLGGINQTSHLLIDFIDTLNIFVLNSPVPIQQKLTPLIIEMTKAHTRNDWLCLADIIQYHIYEVLKD